MFVASGGGSLRGRSVRSSLTKGKVRVLLVVVLGVAAFLAIGVLTLLGAPEWIEFVVAMGMFVALLVGAYLFVIAPQKQREEERNSD